MANHPDFPWLAKALQDKSWSNYFEVLNPSDVEMEKIENRRMIKVLTDKGDDLTKTRDIEHFLYFKTQGNRRGFLTALDLPRFKVIDMPIEKTESGDYPFKLVISRQDKPELANMDQITIKFVQLAKKNNGRYDGWKTLVMK
jgi:regulator of RNase E activity RraB